jgi:hypothetical protein
MEGISSPLHFFNRSRPRRDRCSLTAQQLRRAASIKEQLDALNRELRSLLDGSNGVAPEKKRTGLNSNILLEAIAISQRSNTMR